MPSPSVDRQTFLSNLRESGLVSEEKLADLIAALPESNRGRLVARALVESNVLTRFQAERLLMGLTGGFMLGQYRILDQIGRGGMGRVFKAQHRTMKRIVALKVLAPELLKTERAIELFQHEVRATGRLVHPNIVTAYDANEIKGRYYLVLEFVDGPNLDQLVRERGHLSVGLACDYIRQVACGLMCAHALGMVHRDIKPANILVQWHGNAGDGAPGLVKISDFGLARFSAPDAANPVTGHAGTIATKQNTVMGTPDFLSPEQARCLHQTDVRSDLYSLGCTFYFLLTGSVPYPGGNALDKIIRHSSSNPAPINGIHSEVPPEVLAIVARLMAKQPEDRFQTPAELYQALEPFAVSGPTPWAPAPARFPVDCDVELADLAEDVPTNAGDIVSAPSEELSAFASTISNDQSPTPAAKTGPLSPALLRGRARARARRRFALIAVGSALFALALGLGLLLYFAFNAKH
jgi:serine/threonine-protein kinase